MALSRVSTVEGDHTGTRGVECFFFAALSFHATTCSIIELRVQLDPTRLDSTQLMQHAAHARRLFGSYASERIQGGGQTISSVVDNP